MNLMMLKFKFNNCSNLWQTASKGFTLLEVLAALAVISIALVALFSSLSQGTRLTTRVEERMIGNWVASNVMTEIKTESSWPQVGEKNSDVEMAGRVWHVTHDIKETEDENIRRIDVIVSLDNKGSYRVASLFGYFINPKPKLGNVDQAQFTQ